jgi:hypothetical protein
MGVTLSELQLHTFAWLNSPNPSECRAAHTEHRCQKLTFPALPFSEHSHSTFLFIAAPHSITMTGWLTPLYGGGYWVAVRQLAAVSSLAAASCAAPVTPVA